MGEVIRVRGGRVALDAIDAETIDLRIHDGRILPFDSIVEPTREIDASGHLLLPGLINAHDHLEFALFPRLGEGPWPNAHDWACEIYRPDESPIREHRAVPRRARLLWGAIRNLICGVTTVAHHNPFEADFSDPAFPVRVVQQFGWAHSLGFSADVCERRQQTPARWPFIIHAAEGIDERARQELTTLEELGVLDEDTVLVHATGATAEQLGGARSGGFDRLVPEFQSVLFGRTLCSCAVHQFPKLSLGTDSSLTADGDLVDELEVASSHADLGAVNLFRVVTANPARALRLNEGEATIRENGRADVIAVRDRGQTPAEALSDLPPELVIVGGEVVMMSEAFALQHPESIMEPLEIESRGRFRIRAPIRHLIRTATSVLGSDVRLAGKRVST